MGHDDEQETQEHGLHTLLSQDHARLDAMFEQLTAAFGADAGSDLLPLWAAFERDLRAHLDLEERHILPKFAQFAPDEAAELLHEHTQIRSLLAQLGVALDLHLTRADMVAEFIRMLRSHAAREDALMYRWAQSHLSGPTRTTVAAQLRGAVRKLVGATGGA